MESESPAISVAVESLGCKLNQAEVATWARDLQRAGYRIVDAREKAQVYILNTCTLTHIADRKSRHLLRMARRRNPGALIVAAGCYAERAADEIARIDEVDLVLGNGDKERLVELIQERRDSAPKQGSSRLSSGTATNENELSKERPATSFDLIPWPPSLSRKGEDLIWGTPRASRLLCHSEPFAPCHSERSEESVAAQDRLREESRTGPGPFASLRVTDKPQGSRTRALVKIQDGCNEFCTYCIVPLVRGRQRSRPAGDVLSDVKERVAEGHKEVVLTGTQIGTYGRDATGAEDLCTLVKRILAETPVARLRLTSIHSHDLSADLLALWRDERLCRQLHLSLQSGSDAVLQRMGRPYSTAAFARAVDKVREMIPDVAITTDVIVGFPGESDAEFEEGRLFCAKMGFARTHVFVYSARPGTVASTLRGKIPDRTKKERSQSMLALADEAGRRFREGFLGRELTVLWEAHENGERPERLWSGLTGNYMKVYARVSEDLSNRLFRARLARTYRDGLWGELAPPDRICPTH